jgi:TRAP-type C4-dicarboxylate transport system permease small subunit
VPSGITDNLKGLLKGYSLFIQGLVRCMNVLAALGILAMMLITTIDVVLRLPFIGRAFTGAYDLVCLCGSLSIACALPYTTAVKGHVAVEYFFHKLNRPGRILIDTLLRLLSMGLFGVLARQSFLYARNLRLSHQVSATLQLPLWPAVAVIGLSCSVVVLVILHNLLHPGKEMIRP